MKAYLTYALNHKGNLVHIDSVPNGNDCGCVCPYCESKLCAKNGGTGEKMVHHFAHLSGADCAGAIESALHKMAKDIMKETLCLQLPARSGEFKGELVKFDKVEVEFYDKETQLRPDCIGYYKDKIIWIEFKRTHAVDTKKKGKIISAKIDCVELDINNCALDPNTVRKFITEESDNRIWIRDIESKIRNANSESHYNYDYNDYYYYRDNKRVFALDENGELINSLNDEFNMNEHRYYCIVCGKELSIDIDKTGLYNFVHVENEVHCEDKLYLREAAKEILLWKFNSTKNFEIHVPQHHFCTEKSNCKLFLSKLCFIDKGVPYNLKDCYNECVKDIQLPDLNYKCDLVIKNDNNNDAIIINIDVNNSPIDVNDFVVNIKNYRVIKIKVNNEQSLLSLLNGPIKEGQSTFLNFKRENNKLLVPQTEINRSVLKFSLFSSGKNYVETIPCTKINENKRSTIFEYIFVDGISYYEDAKLYSLLKCYEKKRKACYCEICCFSVPTTDFSGTMKETICKRYKTKGTPHYPLKDAPIDCQFFRIDKELVNIDELNYENVKVIEKEL